jgi:lipopolysaccharide biosynthesis glycosyltransferase
MTSIRVFIGYDPAESIAYHTFVHSIMSRSSVPVSFTPIIAKQLPEITRPRDAMQSNEFAFTRWLVPYLCGYEGWAIFADCDMLMLEDINELYELRDESKAVQVVKHNHVPKNELKYLDTVQTKYPRKNWSSVMLINCSKCTQLTPEYVNTAGGLDLHQFKWLEDIEIGEIPKEWNYLVDYYEAQNAVNIKNLHYTEGGPYFKDYIDCDFSEEWQEEFIDMTFCKQKE